MFSISFFEPGATRVEQGLAEHELGLSLGVGQRLGTLEDQALVAQFDHGLEGTLDGRVAPGIRLQVVDVEHELLTALLDGQGHPEGRRVARRLTGVGEQRDALFLDFLAQRDEVLPGGGNLPAALLEQRSGVPHAHHGVDVGQLDELAAEAAGLDHTVGERVGDGHARVIEARSVQQDLQVIQLAILQEGLAVHRLARVVDDVRRVTGHEARLELGGDLLCRLHLDLGARQGPVVDIDEALGVLGAVPAVEEVDLQRLVGRCAERALALGLRGLLTRTLTPGALGVVALRVTATARAGGQDEGGGQAYACQLRCASPS